MPVTYKLKIIDKPTKPKLTKGEISAGNIFNTNINSNTIMP